MINVTPEVYLTALGVLIELIHDLHITPPTGAAVEANVLCKRSEKHKTSAGTEVQAAKRLCLMGLVRFF